MAENALPAGARPANPVKRQPSGRVVVGEPSGPKIAHTLTACCRCRNRKTRCDPSLPRCGPCERANVHCEYFDQAKGTKIPRNFVVYLQHKVRSLEKQLADLEKEELDPDPEDMVRPGAAVRIQEHDETKFLGPSSGIAITRLVMQLAKQFTDAKSITDIVSETRAQHIKEKFNEEGEKPTSKIYPLISDVAAEELPQRDLTNLLVQLFCCKVFAMYPIFHEVILAQDVEAVYNESRDPFQNFIVRMVIAISLQRMDTQYAGLADSYYLAALRYLEEAVKPMNVKTIQCFTLIGVYSLLTPTRTAVFFVIGLATRLALALGLFEEKTIVQGPRGRPANFLEIDMRRRVALCTMNMEFALAHSIGRPSCFATALDHLDVRFFEMVDDHYITRDGVTPGAPMSLKKWIAIHFFRMRLLQLEIRRKLYQRKRPEPKDDQDPWFQQMEAKLIEWRDSSPETDAGSGMNKVWFIGRYHTMIVFLFRPSPQVPRPSLRAARQCYNASTYNIYMQRDQIAGKTVELTWIFTQSIFMAINTILWTLSYYEIRQEHSREDVAKNLDVALECIAKAIERWPGVASAHELYRSLIEAIMKIYDKDGDIPIAVGSPESSTDPARSRTTSPSFESPQSTAQSSISMSSDSTMHFGHVIQPQPPFNQFSPSANQFSPSANQDAIIAAAQPSSSISMSQPNGVTTSPPLLATSRRGTDRTSSNTSFGGMSSASLDSTFDPSSGFNPLPNTFSELAVDWNPSFNFTAVQSPSSIHATLPPFDQPLFGNAEGMLDPHQPQVQYADYLYPPSWNMERTGGVGLTQQQHSELMHSLETDGPGQINPMIQASNALFYPQGRNF